jgi:hypothetical protein
LIWASATRRTVTLSTLTLTAAERCRDGFRPVPGSPPVYTAFTVEQPIGNGHEPG